MKKLLYCAAALAVAFFAGSCQQEKLEPVAESNVVTFTVEAPAGIQTKAKIADGLNVDELIYEVWLTETLGDLENKAQKLYQGKTTMQVVDGVNKATLTLDLVNDQKFTVLFWAQVKDTGVYDTEELNAVTYTKAANLKNAYAANDERLAAFYGVAYVKDTYHVTKEEAYTSGTVTLRRPFAQINLGTLNTSTAYTVVMEKSNMIVTVPTVFNVVNSVASDEKEMTFLMHDVPSGLDEKLKVNDKEYWYAGMNYVFAPKNVVSVEYNILTKLNGGMEATVNNTVPSVPLKENYRTNIIGNLLTSKTDYEIIVDAAFNEPDNNNDYVWGGELVAVTPFDENGVMVYPVKIPSELAWVAQQVNNGINDFDGEVVRISQDLDLAGSYWTPIASNGVFKGTLEGVVLTKTGNTYPTIKNLNVKTEGKASAGLFASCRGTIKNINIQDATVEGHYKTAALVGDGMCAKIENCHVDGAIIISTPFEKDDANHVGGIVGYLSAEPTAYVKNCSVKNAEITGYRDVAAIAGTANGASEVTGNSVENVIVTADQTSDYYVDNKDGNAGAVVGRVHESATIEPNTIGENVTVVVKVNSTTELDYAILDGHKTISVAGEVNMPASAKGKTLTINGVDNTAVIKVASPEGGERLDGSLEGSTVVFNKVTIATASNDPGYHNGYVRPASLTYNECTFNGTYCTVNANPHVFNKCTFNVEGDKYNVWTWGSLEPVFTECVFNCDGKAMLLYGTVDTKLTMNGCVFNDKGDNTVTDKAAIEIGNDYNKSYTLIVNNAKVNGFAINPKGTQTGTTLWANKNSMPKDKLTVIIDGVEWNGKEGLYEDAQGNIHAYTVSAIKESLKVEGATVYVYPNAANEDGLYDIEGKISLAKGVRLIGVGEEPVKINNSWSSNLFAYQAHFTDTYIENIVCDNNLAIDAGIVNGNVVFKKCVFGGKNAHQGVHFDSGDGTVVFEECTFIGRNMLGSSIEKITFNKCYFENKRSSLTGADKWTGVNMWGKYEFNECVFGTEAHCSVKCDGVVAAFNDCKFDDNRDVTSVVNYDGEFDATITFDGNKYVAEGLLEDANGNKVAYSEAGLKDALENGGTVVLANPFTIDQSESNGYGKTGINMTNGGTLDGNGNELGAPGSTGTWDSAINTSGGTIKNIKVTEGFRGIFIKNDSKHNEKLYLDNVTIDGTTYTISCDSGNGLGLEATNSTFKGWTSFAATLGNAKFTDCYFGEGNGNSYCRPYAPTEFVSCEFEAGYRMDPRAAVKFVDCTLDGVALTAANISELVTSNVQNVASVNGIKQVKEGVWKDEQDIYTAITTEGLTSAIADGAETVNLVAGNYTLPEPDLRGKTLTIVGSKDVVIDATAVDARDQFVTGATLKFEGVTLNFGKVNYMGFANTASLTYKNCNINGLQFLFGENVVFEGCSLNSNGAEHTVWTYGVKNVSFTGCDFTYGDRGVNCYSDNDVSGGQTVNFTNCTFATENTASNGAVEINSSFISEGIVVNMESCTAPAYGEMAYVSPWDSTNGAKTTINIK